MATRTISQQIDLTNQAEPVNKYITKIDSEGIKIHPEDQSNNNYIQLDGNGLNIYKNNISIANYGSAARIGNINNFYMLINSGGLEVYSGNTSMAHYGSTIRIGETNNSYLLEDEEGLKFFRDGINIAEFTNSGARIGEKNKSHITLNSTFMELTESTYPLFMVSRVEDRDQSYGKFFNTTLNSQPIVNFIDPNENIEFFNLPNTEDIVQRILTNPREYTAGPVYTDGEYVDKSSIDPDQYSFIYDVYVGIYFYDAIHTGSIVYGEDLNLFFQTNSTFTYIGSSEGYPEGTYLSITYDKQNNRLIIDNNLFDLDTNNQYVKRNVGITISYYYHGYKGDVYASGDISDGQGNILSDKLDAKDAITLPLYKKVSVKHNVTVAANSYATVDFAPAAQTGYTRVGLVGWNTASTHVFIATCTGTTITFCNKTGSSQTCTNAQVDWLFIRSSV